MDDDKQTKQQSEDRDSIKKQKLNTSDASIRLNPQFEACPGLDRQKT